MSYFGSQAGYMYLISAESCNESYLASVESYDSMLARKTAAENPATVLIPTDYD